jgi:urease accessory protein
MTPCAARVCGVAEIGFALGDGGTRLAHLHQRDPLRVLFPAAEPGDASLAVIVTTSGGLVAGDSIAVAVRLGAGAAAHVTAAAAEKIYRSPKARGGATTAITQSLAVDAGGWLEYLPQETILYDGARLRRHTGLTLAQGAGFLGGGIIVFGRRARGEAFTHGLLHERWEVGSGGALVWGDALHLDGDIAARIADPACFDGAAACATLLLAPPDGEPGRFVEGARAVQQQSAFPGLRAGVTVVNSLLVTRWLGPDPLALRRAYGELACHLRQATMGLPARLPRLWHG